MQHPDGWFIEYKTQQKTQKGPEKVITGDIVIIPINTQRNNDEKSTVF